MRHGAFHGIGMGSRRPPVPCRGRRLVPHALSRPDTAAAAIAQGIELCREKKYDAAQGLFEAALELPGTGTKRFRNKPPQISNSERIAALYNIACCQGQLGNIQNGMIALAGALESGERRGMEQCSGEQRMMHGKDCCGGMVKGGGVSSPHLVDSQTPSVSDPQPHPPPNRLR